ATANCSPFFNVERWHLSSLRRRPLLLVLNCGRPRRLEVELHWASDFTGSSAGVPIGGLRRLDRSCRLDGTCGPSPRRCPGAAAARLSSTYEPHSVGPRGPLHAGARLQRSRSLGDRSWGRPGPRHRRPRPGRVGRR
ncbi:unnamed protein product, partial [Ectocarpus sp. 13 AM-2016]